MSNLFYSSTNEKRSGRASHYYENQGEAQGCVDKQNLKAEGMKILTRYKLTTCLDSEVTGEQRKSIRAHKA